MDVMDTLVDWVIDARYGDVPPQVIDVVKKLTLDTIGVAIAGSSAPGCKSVVDLVLEWGGKQEASILVFGGRVPAPNSCLSQLYYGKGTGLGREDTSPRRLCQFYLSWRNIAEDL